MYVDEQCRQFCARSPCNTREQGGGVGDGRKSGVQARGRGAGRPNRMPANKASRPSRVKPRGAEGRGGTSFIPIASVNHLHRRWRIGFFCRFWCFHFGVRARSRSVSAPSILRNFGAPARSSQAGCVRRCLRILLRHPTLARPPLSHPMIECVPSLFPCYASLFAPHDQSRHTYHARNAADLCRYYRRQSRNPLRPHIRYIELASTSTRRDGRRCCLSAAEISARPMTQRDIVHAQLHPCSSCHALRMFSQCAHVPNFLRRLCRISQRFFAVSHRSQGCCTFRLELSE